MTKKEKQIYPRSRKEMLRIMKTAEKEGNLLETVLEEFTMHPFSMPALWDCRDYIFRIERENYEKAPFLMILEDLQDPGNMGTILRTAEGAGVTGIILSKNCVDLYNPKVIRSTMGSIYRMPVMQADLLEILPVLKENKIQTYAAHLKGKNWYHEEDYTEGTAFFIGNEGNGLSDELSDSADCLIKIPMEGKVESLNAAMAAGILMYETARQRRTGR